MSKMVIGEPPEVCEYRPLDGNGRIPFRPRECDRHWWWSTVEPDDDPVPGDTWTHLYLRFEPNGDHQWIEYIETVDWERGDWISRYTCREVTDEDVRRRGIEIPEQCLVRKAPRLDERLALLIAELGLRYSHGQGIMPLRADIALPAPGPGTAGPPDGSSPPIGLDGWTDRTEAAAQQAQAPDEESTASGSAGTPREDRQAAGADASGSEAPDLVTLNQAAAIVHVSKRTLERYKTKGKLPAPAVEGGGGRADRYDWKVMRPWLEATFRIELPAVFPRIRRHA